MYCGDRDEASLTGSFEIVKELLMNAEVFLICNYSAEGIKI
jgi:hypothetical protein